MSDPITGTFVVLNGTSKPITKIVATHLCAGHTDSLEADSLASGESSAAFDLNAKTSHDDRWSVTYLNNNNDTVTGNVTSGEHQIEVAISGKLDGGKDYARTEHFAFSKGVEPKLLGVTLGSAQLQLGDW